MTPNEPPPIVPVSASAFGGLRGRRVVVGVPGIGFRDELRADDPVVQGGRTFVPVLTELDYYRAETEQLEAFAPLVPIDRVWVEIVERPPSSSRISSAALDGPPPKYPTESIAVTTLLGRRVVQRVPDGFVRDLRAVTSVFLDGNGTAVAHICAELDWYRWAGSGTVPTIAKVNATDLWAE